MREILIRCQADLQKGKPARPVVLPALAGSAIRGQDKPIREATILVYLYGPSRTALPCSYPI
ncbi:hypothetical protein [Adhaeribacter aquaticus]|uniref:hypothetical protein n=1 Tax=Adhaeribacter aquaticus TaxID=299567 RepID=UPI00041D6742|nr:hypothetical protein [Adhaeribacter aquaticus]